jgi:hypothetical protein
MFGFLSDAMMLPGPGCRKGHHTGDGSTAEGHQRPKWTGNSLESTFWLLGVELGPLRNDVPCQWTYTPLSGHKRAGKK